MAGNRFGVWRIEEVGTVISVAEDSGASTVSFDALKLTGSQEDDAANEIFIATGALERFKGSKVMPGDAFLAEIDPAAILPQEVEPVILSFVPEPAVEQVSRFGFQL